MGAHLAAADAAAAQALARHPVQDVLAQVGRVEAAQDVLRGDVAHDAVEPDPRVYLLRVRARGSTGVPGQGWG